MHKIRPLWRFIFFFILIICVTVSANNINGTYRGFFTFAIYAAATITWVYLCFAVKYVDPLRGIYEKILENDENGQPGSGINIGTGAPVSGAADPEVVAALKDISDSLEKISRNTAARK